DGSMIRVIHSQPFGGPLSIRVRGVTLSLRRSEADKISVQVVE
ncbi:MAG: FeoA domain-containing protein, partial [Bdellovibrionales bacterium]|nr:FeoA domain-containing protein [Bdellovibrionales bacterium]